MAIRRNTAWRVFETIQEITDGKQRTEKLVEILSATVYACLKHGVSVRKQSPLRRKEN